MNCHRSDKDYFGPAPPRHYQPTQLMAVIPPTQQAAEALRKCALVLPSPVAPPVWQRQVPKPREYFQAVDACLRERGIAVEKDSLWIRSGSAHC